MTLELYYTRQGQYVIGESSEAKALGYTPAQATPTTTYAGGTVTQGQTLSPIPQVNQTGGSVLLGTGTITHPLGATPTDVAVSQGAGGSSTTVYSSGQQQFGERIIFGQFGNMQLALAPSVVAKVGGLAGLNTAMTDYYGQYGIAYGQTLQQFGQGVVDVALHNALYGGSDVMLTPKEYALYQQQQAVYNKAYASVSQKFYSLQDWQQGLLAESMLWSPKGFEFVGSSIGTYFNIKGTSKTPEQVIIEQYTEQQLNKTPFLDVSSWGGFTNSWLTQSIVGSPLGFYSTMALAGYGAGSVIGEASFWSSTIQQGVKLVSVPVGGVLLGAGLGSEAGKLYMETQVYHTPTEQVIGGVFKDVGGAVAFGYGFRVGVAEGLPFKYWGKQEVPIQTITTQEVISGQQTFPYSHETPAGLVSEFKYNEWKPPSAYNWEVGGWSATTYPFGQYETVGAGGQPAMWIAPSLSPHFLRFDWSSYSPLTEGSIEAGGRALWVQVEDIGRVPEGLRTDQAGMWDWLQTSGSRTWAYVSPEFELGKPESEAVILKGAFMERTSTGFGGFSEYSKWEGLRFPIFHYTILPTGTGTAEATSKVFSSAGNVFEFIESGSYKMGEYAGTSTLLNFGNVYQYPSYTPLVSPSYTPSSSKPSYTFRLSEPSIVPSSTTRSSFTPSSYVPSSSYTPSQTPSSYVPSSSYVSLSPSTSSVAPSSYYIKFTPYYTSLFGGSMATQKGKRRRQLQISLGRGKTLTGTPISDLLNITVTEAGLLRKGKSPIATVLTGKKATHYFFKSAGLNIPTVQQVGGKLGKFKFW